MISILICSCKTTKIERVAFETGVEYPVLTPKMNGDLLHFEKVRQISKQQILENIPEKKEINTYMPDLNISEYAKYDISIYRIYYSSRLGKKKIVLSGMVMIPDLTDSLPQFQFHHGTTFPVPMYGGFGALEAPSLYNGQGPSKEQEQFGGRVLHAIPASSGYLVSAPDYAGYSISKDEEHPYVHHNELAKSSVDMLLATQQLANQLNVKMSGKIFLAGWSEGAGAALAVHKLIEESYSSLEVTATAPFAGPYNYARFIKEVITSKKSMEEMPIYNWSIYSLNKFADEPMSPSQIWKYPVNNQFDALNLPSNWAKDIFLSDFIDLYRNGDTPLNKECIKNTLHEGWSPKGNIYFHSGKKDKIVPHYNSVDAFAALKLHGTGEVEIYEYDGDHYTPVIKYLITMINDFNGLK